MKINLELHAPVWLILFIFFLPSVSYAACSTQKGSATINELAVVPGDYIEIVTLSPITTNGWSIYMCTQDNNKQCDTLAISGTTSQFDPNTNRTYYRFATSGGNINKVQAILLDGSDNPIDFLNATGGSNYSVINTKLSGCSAFAYDTTANPGAQNKLIFRGPDGTGDWQVDPDTGNNTNYTDVSNNNNNPNCTIPDYNLSKRVDNATPFMGNEVNYTLTLKNLGCKPRTTATLTDMLPSELSFNSSAPAGDDSSHWSVSPLAYNETRIITINATVIGGGGTTIRNDANVTIADDYNMTNNSAYVNITPISTTANPRLGSFTVVDRSLSCNAVANWGDSIATKIAGESKDFWLLAKDSETLEVMSDANIRTLKLRYYSAGGSGVCSGTPIYERSVCDNCGVTDSQGCLALNGVVFENRASKCTAFYIEGVDNNVSGALDTNATSIDNFAIRPDRFFLEAPLSAYAAEHFVLNMSAYNYGNTQNTLGYNESISSASSVRIDANETNIACRDALEAFDYNESRSFLDGVANAIEARHSGLARPLTIKIEELNGSEFAFVDRDDTADVLRFITPYELNVTIYPYELNVTRSEIDASIAGSEWIYMADVKDMNITLLAEVSAFNKNGVALRDFNASCYAEDVNVAFEVATDGNAALAMNYGIAQGEFVTLGDTLGDVNRTLIIRAENFLSGEGQAGYALNVDRKFSAPVAPFQVGNLDANVTTTNISKVVNGNFKDGNFTFYYGRASAKDIKTSQVLAEHFAEFEVYDPQNYINKGFKQNSLNWYRNQDHNATTFGNISSVDSQPSGIINSLNPINSGLVTFSINNSAATKSADMHIRTDEWLWYTPIDNGFDNVNLNCSQHPCFKYTFTPSSLDKRGIQSGSFQGSDIDVKDRGDYQKTGIKVFR